jgi:putative phage-type endonuclease
MNRLEWLKGRTKGLGGSDIAAIMGLSKWNSPTDIWESKTGRTEVVDEMNDTCYWGTEMEATLVTEFEKQTGLKVKTDNKQRAHSKYSYMIGNIDGYIESESAGLECKTAGEFMRKDWGEPGTNDIPIAYYLQVQHYMNIYDIPMFYVIVSIGGKRPVIYSVGKDQECIDRIEASCALFWETYVLKDEQPPLIDSDRAKLAESVASVKGAAIVSDSVELAEDLEKIKELKGFEKQLKEQLKEISTRVQGFMLENENLLNDTGDVLCTWKGCITKRFDAKKLKEDNPELHAKYVNETESRRFLVK